MIHTNGLAVGVPCAVAAAAAFGVANVEQMRAARKVEAPERVSATLILRLFRDRGWWVGLGASIAAYLLQAVALYLAPVVVVQPLIVTELLFALPLAARVSGRRLGAREWCATLAVAGGITSFLVVGHPSGHSSEMATSTTVAVGVAVAAVVGVLVVTAETQRGKPMLRASLLAVAASVCFGMLSVMTKVVAHQFQRDLLGALLHPQPYLLAAAALVGLLLAQTAFRIAPLSVGLPLIDIGEPMVASLLAAVGLGERLDVSAASAAGVAIALAVLVVGVALLDTSPLVRSVQEDVTATVTSADRPQAASKGAVGVAKSASAG